MSDSMPDQIARLRENIERVFLGDPDAIDRLLVCLIARGHALIEDVPGVGKTVLASALARSVDCQFTRVQLTPDMLPADILGVTIFDRDSSEFRFRKGPVFTNILLADEINRATPRTQTALLEAMNESSVSIDSRVYTLGPPFIVLATQNPYEFEGTFLLPENQLDRFLMRISLGYPTPEAEAHMLEARPAQFALQSLEPVLHASDVVALQERADRVRLDESLRGYIVELARATREHPEIQVGLSPRGSLALAQSARATAVVRGRDYVTPEDIVENIAPVGSHRIFTRARATGAHDDPSSLLREVADTLEIPV